MSEKSPFKVNDDGRVVPTRPVRPGERLEVCPPLCPCTCPRSRPMKGIDDAPQRRELAFRVGPSPMGGLGVFAARTISIGEVILHERPLFTATCLCCETGTTTVDQLDAQASKKFYSLVDSHNPTPTAKGIFDTNAFEIIPLGERLILNGVYEIGSRFNHHCSPNATRSCDPRDNTLQIVAQRDIPQGSEIFIPYIDLLQPRDERIKRFRETFKMECACEMCHLPKKKQARSCERRSLLAYAQSPQLDELYMREPLMVYQFAKRCLRILDRELPDDHRTRHTLRRLACMSAAVLQDRSKIEKQAALNWADYWFLCGRTTRWQPGWWEDFDHRPTCPRNKPVLHDNPKFDDICDHCGNKASLACVDCGYTEYCHKKCMEDHRAVHEAACRLLSARKR